MIHHTIEHKTRHSLIFDPRLYDSLNFGTLWSGAFQDRDSSSFKTSFKRHVIGLSFEVYNSFLPQLASKLRAVESGSPEKVPEL